MQLNGVEKKHVKDIVFTNLNLDLPNTGVFLVTGSNGAGKTTLLNIITNITSYKGRVSNPYLNNMSITFQNSYLLNNYTIKEHLDLFAINYKYLSKVNLNDKLDYYPYNLSSGEKQRVANILSLCSDRKLVLLDEPFANLDAKNKRIISSMIKEYKKSKLILIVSHDNYELKNLDGVIFVNQEGAILKKYTKFKYEKIDTCYKRKKTKIKVYHKRKHIKVGLILALIPLIIFLVFNAINVAYYILEKDIHNSVDYNKFYLKSCETLIDGNFEINECENPNLEQLKYIDYGYNYDYLLGYLYKRDDLRVVNNSDIKLHFGEYPKRYIYKNLMRSMERGIL